MLRIPSHRLAATLLLFALLLASGCSETRIGDFNAISTKNIYAKGVNVRALPKTDAVEGERLYFDGWGANIKDAVDAALENGHGNLLIDAVLYSEFQDFLFFNLSGYKVRGTVVNVP